MREISRHGMTIVTKSPSLNGPEEGRPTVFFMWMVHDGH